MKKLSSFLIITALLVSVVSSSIVSFADTNDAAPNEAAAKGVISIEEKSGSKQLENEASASRSGVVHVKVYCIGSGLVDLDTSITMGSDIIVTTSGTHWFKANGKSYGNNLYRNNINTTFAAFSDQFSLPVGTVITSCGAKGVVQLTTYSLPFATIPYDPHAIVK